MIFRRGKKRDDVDAVPTEESELGGETEHADAELAGAALGPGDVDPEAFDPTELDGRDWRSSGPHDIAEVDPDDEPDDEPRIDLGSMILTAFDGAELRLQVAEETGQIVSAMLISDNSALELGAYAAPRSGGLWAELRDEMIEAATEAGGDASLAAGPFGVELRRLLPVTTPEGEEGYQPSRMWVVEGPRWLLRGIVYGEAALTDGEEPPVAELLTAFRRVVVRRGDEAMAPGDLLPLSMPENLVAAEAE
ncbi:MAG TPA: DUF3710 domain-containing protein [Propionibacteriaceae bacterium]|nr:DUF3710 domain-containing protein [Propionibacteriaceae bacterium]